MNLIFKSHLKTDASITIRDFMGNINEPHMIWKDLLAHYHYSPTTHDQADIYETKLLQLCPEQFPTLSAFCLEFMKVLAKFD